MSLFPNVPNVPGVPALPRDPFRLVSSIVLLAADAISFFGDLLAPRWGIYLNGAPVVIPDSIVAFDFRQGWTLADFPIENGGFESYDKVATPFDARMRIASGGSEANRQALLDQLAAIAPGVDLLDVVTPEVVYANANIQRYDYRRTSINGVGLLTVDVWLQEVRVATAPAFTSTQSASGASPQNGGTVQTSSFDEAGFSAGAVT